MTLPISAFIITRNEEARLPATLAALRPLASEILVVDSGSTDRTVEIAQQMGARVLHRAWTGYGPQKKFAEQQCRYEWVLNVDADEVVTHALAAEIWRLFEKAREPEPNAYTMNILTVYPGEKRPRPLARDYNVVRLYHRAIASYRDHPVHDRVMHDGFTPVQLSEPIFHYPYVSFSHLIDKNNKFSSFRSKKSKQYNKTYLIARLIYEFPLNFLKSYLLRRHFTGGWKGFYFSLCQAFMRTSRVAKMLEAVQREAAGDHTRKMTWPQLRDMDVKSGNEIAEISSSGITPNTGSVAPKACPSSRYQRLS